jgi:hypothetical protein
MQAIDREMIKQSFKKQRVMVWADFIRKFLD